jgi:hypothetical protein
MRWASIDGERRGTRRVLRRSSSECFQALSDNSRIKISQAWERETETERETERERQRGRHREGERDRERQRQRGRDRERERERGRERQRQRGRDIERERETERQRERQRQRGRHREGERERETERSKKRDEKVRAEKCLTFANTIGASQLTIYSEGRRGGGISRDERDREWREEKKKGLYIFRRFFQ